MEEKEAGQQKEKGWHAISIAGKKVPVRIILAVGIILAVLIGYALLPPKSSDAASKNSLRDLIKSVGGAQPDIKSDAEVSEAVVAISNDLEKSRSNLSDIDEKLG